MTEQIAKEILNSSLDEEIVSSFLPYALAVVEERAIPDSRDGLKPVQRRIIYGMYEMGLDPSGPYKKSARVVGDVMGKYHPHGDASIYDALVRMTNKELTNLPLIDGHGNFGRVDPELRAAASRYTEAKLSIAALSMTEEIKENTVPIVPNFDSEEVEPVVLPAAFPNLLVNGSSGVAVGIATSIPSHNLKEVADYCVALVDGAKEEDMPLLYPDFPSGGVVVDDEIARESIRSGKGSIRLRGKYRVESQGRKRFIIFYELPYGAYPRRIIEQIANARAKGSLKQVLSAKDFTDRLGISIVIEIVPTSNPEALLEELYRLCDLETKAQINIWALDESRPKQFTARELALVFINFRLEVIRSRTKFRLDKVEKRLHLVEGILFTWSILDQVIQTIKTSNRPTEDLVALGLSQIQATYVLDLQLRRLANIEIEKYAKEKTSLEKEAKSLTELLNSEQKQKKLFKEELLAVANKLGVDRKSKIVQIDQVKNEIASSTSSLLLEDQDVSVALSNGQISRNRKVGNNYVATNLYGKLTVVTSLGKAYQVGVAEIPERLTKVSELLEISVKEEPIAIIDADRVTSIVLWTKSGATKRLVVSEIKDGLPIVTLKEGDEIVSCYGVKDEESLGVAISKNGQLLHYKISDIAPKGRQAGTIAGMTLREDDLLIGAYLAKDDDLLATITDANGLKVTRIGDFPVTARGSIGTRIQRFLAKETDIKLAIVGPCATVVAITEDKKIASLPEPTPRGGSSTPTNWIGLSYLCLAK